MRITPETLRMRAAIAQDAGRDRLAMNWRAAELTAVPDDRIARDLQRPAPIPFHPGGAAGDR